MKFLIQNRRYKKKGYYSYPSEFKLNFNPFYPVTHTLCGALPYAHPPSSPHFCDPPPPSPIVPCGPPLTLGSRFRACVHCAEEKKNLLCSAVCDGKKIIPSKDST